MYETCVLQFLFHLRFGYGLVCNILWHRCNEAAKRNYTTKITVSFGMKGRRFALYASYPNLLCISTCRDMIIRASFAFFTA